MNDLVIVFMNWDDICKAATVLYIAKRSEDLIPENFKNSEHLSIGEFFEKQRISVNKISRMFPGCLIPDRRDKAGKMVSKIEIRFIRTLFERFLPASWKTLKKQELPMDEKNIQRLADFLKMPIHIFVQYRRLDSFPRPIYSVNPVR